jgi:AbiV family abortive infection protein
MTTRKDKKQDYLTGFRYGTQNAFDHLKAAKLLTEINYGIATAHLVLAIEEGIKAYAIFCRYRESSLYKEDFNLFFRYHKFKHESIWRFEEIFTAFFIFGERMFKHFSQYSKKYLKGAELPERRKKEIEECIQLCKEIQEENIKLRSWCENADALKMAGFYLDIVDGGKSWLRPGRITKETYDESLKIVEKWLEHLAGIEKIESA